MKDDQAPAPFRCFTTEAFDFLAGLTLNNNRDWFQARKDVYERACKAPFQALTIALHPPDGASHITRIYRDVRFSKDKSPYHVHVSTVVNGSFLRLSADGLYVGTGLYMPEPPVLRRLREAIDQDATGCELEGIVASLRGKGYTVGSHESTAGAPRGFRADHPRLEFLRMKDLHAGTTLAPSAVSTSKALAKVQKACADVAPVLEWIRRNVGEVSCG